MFYNVSSALPISLLLTEIVLFAFIVKKSIDYDRTLKYKIFLTIVIIVLATFITTSLFSLGFLSGKGRVVSKPIPYAQQIDKGVVYKVIVKYVGKNKNNYVLNLTKVMNDPNHDVIVIRVKRPVPYKYFMLNNEGVPIRVSMK